MKEFVKCSLLGPVNEGILNNSLNYSSHLGVLNKSHIVKQSQALF